MTCNEIRELMPDLAADMSAPTAETKEHLHACAECAGKLEALPPDHGAAGRVAGAGAFAVF